MKGSPFEQKFTRLLPYFIIPVLLNFFIVFIPLCNAFYYSLNSTYSFKLSFTGLDNYARLLGDKIFWFSLKNNLIIIACTVLFQIGPAVVICMMMTTSNLVMGKKFIQSIYFFPSIISAVVIGYIWKIMYSNQYGLINAILSGIGMDGWKQNWLGDPKIIMTSIIIPLSWQFIGFYLVILLAGVTGIDREILEVAEIDGATGFKKTIYVIMPMLKSTLIVMMTICVSGGIKIFDQIYAISRGGPGYASSVLAMMAYSTSFAQNDYGYGSAISIAMLLISLAGVMISKAVIKGVAAHDHE